ncbi:hypothetical protein LOCC1_G006541 [Lachnellula occidentalis]|uniref:Chromatin SPT2 n=1 Tax=Lachnellula occidentalis TaxID=215460 RepID=A0A8H8U9Y7_9HELO|nr:hypothetical protein LOCC1_G006541 [Lachnellula occidentalis]
MAQIGDLLAQITGEPRASSSPLPNPPKRKAPTTDTLRRPADKLQRTNAPPTSTSRPVNVNPSSKPSTSTSFKNGQPTPPPNDGAPLTSTPAKAPKKGSFAEIMARGKAVQATRGQVGQIRHKRIEKLPSKKEREEMKGGGVRVGKNMGPGSGGGKFKNGVTQNGKSGAGGSGGASGSGIKGIRKDQEPEKKIKKAAMATTGYSGTARPKPGSSSTSQSRPSARPPASSSKERYTYASEEEDEEGDVDMDQGGYASDVSSDMEAAAFEVDEEEEYAARAARKEDAEALAEENRMKREKAEKKRRLMEMAARRR